MASDQDQSLKEFGPALKEGSEKWLESERIITEMIQVTTLHLSLHDTLKQCLDVLLQTTWLSIEDKAGIFLVGDDQKTLELFVDRNLGNKITKLCSNVPFGHCLCGRAALLQATQHANCVDERHDIQFEGMKPHGHYNVPILRDGKVLGVMVFYLPHGFIRKPSEVAFLESAANILSLVIELKSHETRLEDKVAKRTQQLKAEKKSGKLQAAALYESESRLNELLELVPAAIISIDEEGQICLFNKSAETLFGYSKEEMFGSSLDVLLPKQFRGAHQAQVNAFSKSGSSVKVMARRSEISGLKRDGSEFPARGSISKLQFEGRTLYTILIQDITEQKETACVLEDQNKELRERDVVLETQNQRFDAALTNIPVGLCMFDGNGNLIISNEKYAALYDISPDLIKPGISFPDIIDIRIAHDTYACSDPEEYRREMREWALNKQKKVYRHQLNDGRYIEVRNHLMADGGWLATHDDVTERVIAETLLNDQNQRFNAAVSAMSHGLSMFDGDENIIISNERYATIYGLDPDQVKSGMSLTDVIELRIKHGQYTGLDPDELRKEMARLRGDRTARLRKYILSDGRYVEIRDHPMANGGWLSIHEDVTDRHETEQKIRFLANYDTLTGLPNRTQTHEVLEGAMRQAVEDGTRMALLYIDLDGFKEVNDTLGHPAGDHVLNQVGARLEKFLGDTVLAGRLSGDEFIMIVKEFDYLPYLERLADRICAAIAVPVHVEHDVIVLSASIGISIGPPEDGELDTFIKYSDLALYKAKSDGGNRYCFFEEEMFTQAQERQRMAADLRDAIQKNELVLHYQPQVDLRTGKINGYEALVRWQHDELGMISPFQFIGLAEETGQISEIGEWVLRTACNYALTWPNKEKVSVNLSPVQFKRQDVCTMVKRILWETGLPPERLELEITESVLIHSTDSVIIVLRTLAEMGISIALDDFGTGFSSLSYLTTFPFGKIKIDKSFIDDLGKDTEVTAIVAMIIGLGRSLDTVITAEGIEEFRQHELLRASGCDQGQGYMYGKPEPLILTESHLAIEQVA